MQEINNLGSNKATQATDVSTRINKANKELEVFYIYHNFYDALSSSVFPIFQYSDMGPTFKKGDKTAWTKQVMGQIAFFQA